MGSRDVIPSAAIAYGGREYTLAVGLGHASDIEAECGGVAADGSRRPKPISDVATAIVAGLSHQPGGYSIKDATEPLRIGLIGGGMAHGDAQAVVERVAKYDGLAKCAEFSLVAIQIALHGVPKMPDDGVDKKKASQSPAPKSS